MGCSEGFFDTVVSFTTLRSTSRNVNVADFLILTLSLTSVQNVAFGLVPANLAVLDPRRLAVVVPTASKHRELVAGLLALLTWQ
jgi:hypothetical protein